MIQTLCLVGVGLIGGSLALDLRRKGLVREVRGVDRDALNLKDALRLGLIDQGFNTLEEGLRGADWVVFSTPVGSLPGLFTTLQRHYRPEVIYTDTGSTKRDVVRALEAAFGSCPARFVPGHPIAGAECSGARSAQPDLFVGRRVILTPNASTDAQALAAVEGAWRALGATVSSMDAAHHDEVLAATSHLPHVLAFTLTEMLGRQDEQQEIFQYAAGGFRDFTRIASSDPRMWVDICLANRQALLPLMAAYQAELGRVMELLEAGREPELLALFAGARDARQRFLEQLER